MPSEAADTNSVTYYVAPIKSEESPGVQTCAYFDHKFIYLSGSHLRAGRGVSFCIGQLPKHRWPLEFPFELDTTANLIAAVVTDPSAPTTPSFHSLSNSWITVEPAVTGATSVTRGAVLLFAVTGTSTLRPSTDPQITNSGIGGD